MDIDCTRFQTMTNDSDILPYEFVDELWYECDLASLTEPVKEYIRRFCQTQGVP